MENTKIDLPMSIPEFYKGNSIFLTGFTGVLGKLIVEKLLYSCSELDTIYVLIRPKKGQTPQQRVEQVLTSRAFIRLREKYPGILESKVVGVAGDLLEERLGLSQEDEQLLKREVRIIMHVAASVRFDDPLGLAVKINTLGAKKMIDLALTIPRLLCFTYISTAYSNSDHLYIKEEVYPPKADWRKTLKICEKIDPATLQTLHAKYIDKMPNTYTFSKSLAEQVINDYRDQLPVVIVRPSAVVPSSKEPSIGWVDNKYGPIGISLGIILGIIKCTAYSKNLKVNNIPSDIVVNAVIAATWKTAIAQNTGSGKDSATVYNVCTPHSLIPLAEGYKKLHFDKEIISDQKKYGISYFFIVCNSKLSYRINVLFRHMLSSYIIDLLLILSRRQPMLVKIRRKIFIVNLEMYYFGFNTFIFESTNFDSLIDHMMPEEREEFGWDSDKFDVLRNNFAKFDQLKHTILKPVYDNIKTVSRALRIFCEYRRFELIAGMMSSVVNGFHIMSNSVEIYHCNGFETKRVTNTLPLVSSGRPIFISLILYIMDKFAVYLTYSTVGFFLYYFNIPLLLLSTVIRLVTLP